MFSYTEREDSCYDRTIVSALNGWYYFLLHNGHGRGLKYCFAQLHKATDIISDCESH